MDSNQSVSLSPAQRTLSQSSSGNSSSLPIRAPPSFDSDSETALKIKSSSSSSSRSSSRSSSDVEEDFVSVGDEEALGSDTKEDLGSSGFPSLMPKAELSDEFDDVVADEELGSEVEDEGDLSGEELKEMDNVGEVPKVRVLGDGEGEGGESSVELGLVGDSGVVDKGSEVVGDDGVAENSNFVENSEGVLGSEMIEADRVVEPPKVSVLESEEGGKAESSVVSELIGDSGIADKGSEVIGNVGLVEKSDFVKNTEIGVLGAETIEGNKLVEAPKVEALRPEEGVEGQSSVSSGLTGDSGIADKGSEAIGDVGLVEKSNFVKNSEIGVLDAEIIEGNKLVEAPKVDVLQPEKGVEGQSSVSSGLIGDSGIAAKSSELIGDDGLVEKSVVEIPDNGVFGSEGKVQELAVESNSAALVEDRVPGVNEATVEALAKSVASKEDDIPDDSKFTDVVNPEIGRTVMEETALKDGAVEEKKSESLGGEQADGVSSSTGAVSVIDMEQPIKVEENGVSDVKEMDNSVEGSKALDHGSGAASVVIQELDDSKLVEVDKDVANNGDSSVVTNLLESDIAAVGNVDEKIHSETEAMGLTVERSASLGLEPDHAAPVDQKLVEASNDIAKVDEQSDLKNTASEQNLGPVTKSEFEIQERELQEPKAEVEKDNDEKNGTAGDENVSLDPNNSTVKPDFGTESLTDLGAWQNEEVAVASTSPSPEPTVPSSVLVPEVKEKVENEAKPHPDYEEEDNGSVIDEDDEGMMFDGSEMAERFMKILAQGSGARGGEGSQDHSQRIDGQIVMDSDEEADTDDEGEGKELFDSAALTALLKAANSAGSEGGAVTITSSDGSRLFSVERPAGLGSSVRQLKPAPRPNRTNPFAPSDRAIAEESENNLSEEEKKKLEKIQLIRVKFLRLVHRLGQSTDDPLVAQVLYRFVLAAGRHSSPAFSLEAAKRTALKLEEDGKDDLDFSLNILVLGKTGVGKSATINSIFGEEKTTISAFKPATTTVKEITGTIGGVKIRVLDTPGLRPSIMEQVFNRKVLLSVKKFTKKCPPDIMLYVDRMDSQTRDLNDLPLLRSITNALGSSIWRNAVVTLTHAASAPPDGPSGAPLSYEMFVAQRTHIVQQSIGQAVGDLRLMNPSLMNPVSLVENHQSCRRNREGQKILPNGLVWRQQLLLFCYSFKILSEVNSLSKPQDPFDHRKLFGFRVRSPPLPYLLSSLLQSRAHPKLPTDQSVETGDSDVDLDDLVDSEQDEEEDEYDQLPPFKPLRKDQVANLSNEQRKAYFDEYDYRVKLLQKKQWKEELKRMKEMKKRGKGYTDDYGNMGEDADQENAPAAVPVPLPDMVLPPSFDGDNPAYRYRFLEPTSQLLSRPVLDTHGWDHDCGYDGVSLEESLAIAGRFPAAIAVQITKDKKEFNIHMDSSVAAKHGEDESTMAGFDIQTVGKQLAYILRGETKFRKLKKNKMACGVSVTFLGENVATGLKFEDRISIGNRFNLVGSTGAMRSQGDVAYGANLEACLKEKDFPVGQDQSTLGLSLMKWRGDLALGANFQSQISIGRSSKMAVRVGLNNKLSGQITVRTSSSEHLQLALASLLPIAMSIYRSIWPEAGESYSAY